MSQVSALTEGNSDVRVTLAALFTEFLKVSLCSFGGGLVGRAALSSNSGIG